MVRTRFLCLGTYSGIYLRTNRRNSEQNVKRILLEIKKNTDSEVRFGYVVVICITTVLH